MNIVFFRDPTLEHTIRLIESGEAIIVADGSFLPHNGIATAAWVLAGNAGPIEATGYSCLPDGNYMNDAYRAELFGLSLTSPKSHQPARRRLRRNILKSEKIMA